ncbi:MAG: hypothetical protein A2X11_00035 [Bacteroidetes bacterium GWE2_42_24]|nr:MAG: hypothetical protein A2X11_00035 [Bacteroidetes bacterium GWE2_42_24]
MTQYPMQLRKIEAHLRRRLRARIIVQQKRKINLVHKLEKMGINRSDGRRAVYRNRGTWAMSRISVVEKAFSVRWFVEAVGQKNRV